MGKTVIALTAVHELMYNRFEVGKALVIAPKKVAQTTWTRECEKWDHLRDMRVSVMLGTEAQRVRALSRQADVYIINRDNVKWLTEYLGHAWPFDTVIIDELSSFKSAKSRRWRALRVMLPKIRRLYGLTGTPAPNSLEDIWAQVYLLDEGRRLGRTLTGFRDAYFDHNPYRHEYIARRGSQRAVEEAIKDICISMSARDYLTLPDCIVVDVPVELEPAARQAYKRLEREMLLQVNEDTIEARGAAALGGKLLQLCNGALYNDAGGVTELHTCKLDALAETVEALNGQHALLFYSFRHDIPRIKSRLKKLGGVRIRDLSTPDDERAWNAGEVDVLLAHPASAAYGLNLQDGGHHVIWYGLTWSLELYQQANKRLHRQGQKEPVMIHRLLTQGGIDENVAEALEDKAGSQDALLAALKARIRRVKKGD